jgi:putative acetyltransferase
MADATIRDTTPEDVPRVLALYPRAFPEEALAPLVSTLLATVPGVLSLAGVEEDEVVAHGLFTPSASEAGEGALLGPLGVVPRLRRRGLGASLVRAGLRRLEAAGCRQVFVLGDPGYYRRFGFSPERRVLPPCPVPEAWADAWQSRSLAARPPLAAGRLLLPTPWMDPALWAP